MNTYAKYAKFQELDICDISPRGWMREYLLAQKEGITGHLDEIGYPFNTHCWSHKEGKHGGLRAWWPFEQVAYYLDGVSRCGHLLRDEFLINKFESEIEPLIQRQDADGFLGAEEIKEPIGNAQWPHSILFRGIYAHYCATKDESLLEAMTKHYFSNTCSYDNGRDIVNIEDMLLIYSKTGNKALLELAEKSFLSFNKMDTGYGEYNQVTSNNDVALAGLASDKRISTHGVTFSELSKIGAILYNYTGNQKYLDAVVHGFDKAEKQALLVDGVVSSTEGLKSNTAEDCHESCDISDYTWSLGYLLMATGNPHYADIIERAMLNASPSVHYDNFNTALYFSSPNMVIAKPNSNSANSYPQTPRMAYQPHHYPECCISNINRAMPNFISRMFMEQDGGVVATFYGESVLDKQIDDNHIIVEEKTNYPFDNTVTFNIKCDKNFKFTYRIPEWCKSSTATLNGEVIGNEVGFNDVEVENNATVVLTFDMPVEVHKWSAGGVYVQKGPLLYSLKIKEKVTWDRLEKRQTKDFKAYSMEPDSPFNYAINIEKALATAKVVKKPMTENPFFDTPHDEITLVANKLHNWKIKKESLNRKLRLPSMDIMTDRGTGLVRETYLEITPKLPRAKFVKTHLGKEETITLIPYGCTHLRLTLFPENK